MPIKHKKTDTIANWTQADLDAQIALGNYPPGTVLADIILPSDWNDDHTNPDIADVNGLTAALAGKQGTLTLTTTGSSGAATLVGNTLNIPQYTGSVSSVFGRTGAVTAQSGDYTTAQVTEVTNLYFTDLRARGAISLTTSGTSGASTYNNTTGVLNVPQYQAQGNYITALTGDVTASGPGSSAATLATVNANTGSFGSTTNIPSFTVNAKGLITAASNNAVVFPANTTATANQFFTAYNSTTGAFTKGSVTGAALTKTDDTNVTLTLGGSPTTALLASTSLTLGWTGQLSVARGGTGVGTLTGLVKGNGTAAFSAAVAGTDYQAPITLTTTGSGAATFIGNTLNIPTPAASSPGGSTTQLQYNNAGAFGGMSRVTTNGQDLILTGQASPTYTQGKLVYDTDNESLTFYNNDSNISLQVGQEEWIRVINNTGSTIGNGVPVYLSGASGGLPTIAPAQANTASTTIGAGLTTESIANGATGFVTWGGLVRGLDTSAFTAGATVFISAASPGTLTSTAPSAPNYRYRVGIVGTSSATVGTIHVTPSTAALGNGTANQVLAINSAGTAQEFQSTTGTGNIVRATSPTLVTPSLGVATGTSFNGAAITSAGSATTYLNGAGAYTTPASTPPAGSIVKVAQNKLTTGITTSSTTWTSTGLSQAITPASTSNEILVTAELSVGSAASVPLFRISRGGTIIGVGTSTGTNRIPVTSVGYGGAGSGGNTISVSWLDNPGTTSSTTYSIEWRTYDAAAGYLNRLAGDGDTATVYRPVSTITLMEVQR